MQQHGAAFPLSLFLTKQICLSVDDRPEPTQRRRHHRPSQCYLRGSLQRCGLSGSHRGQCQCSRQPRLVNIHILSAWSCCHCVRWWSLDVHWCWLFVSQDAAALRGLLQRPSSLRVFGEKRRGGDGHDREWRRHCLPEMWPVCCRLWGVWELSERWGVHTHMHTCTHMPYDTEMVLEMIFWKTSRSWSK